MTVWIKQGVLGDLQPIAQKGFGRVVKLYWSRGDDFFCTSLREGNHQPGSFHYLGLAFDFIRNGGILQEIRERLGAGWDVIEFTVNGVKYIHAEFDRK